MYESNAKHTFGRGWAINRIAERLSVPWRQALWLVLAGEDRDRRFLMDRRGVKNENIISVDRKLSAVEHVRDGGGIAIQGNVEEVVGAWPHHTPLHAFMLDFNSGFEGTHMDLVNALLLSPGVAERAVIYANFQRGRDGLGKVRSALKKQTVDGSVLCENGESVEAQQLEGLKNRSHFFLAMFIGLSLRSEDGPELNRRLIFSRRLEGAVPCIATPYRQRDGGVLMDGVVFVRPFGQFASATYLRAPSRLIRQRISAALAIRTARLRRT